MRVRRVVDLSVPLGPSTQGYPGDPRPRLRVHATVSRGGFNLLHVEIGSQSGTHVDAPYHVADSGARVDELSLDLFAGPGVVLDVPGLAPRERIGWDRLAPYADRLGRGTIALLRTRWSRHYGTAHYFENPFLDADAARRLLATGARTLLVDAPSPDETPDHGHPGEGYPVHHLVADAGGVIGENLDLSGLLGLADPFVCCFPVRLEGGDGAPVRAVAMELE